MMIHYTPESVLDLERLRTFIIEQNPVVANRIVGELKQGILRLNSFPMLGVEVMNTPNSMKIRDLFIDDYTIRYLINNTGIYILRVWHDKENERNK
jgi:plasmid stabilization system protein ParE